MSRPGDAGRPGRGIAQSTAAPGGEDKQPDDRRDSAEQCDAGVPVADGYRSGMVALVGRPNAGKSTLLNRLVGAKVAIVSDKPQTTRHRILGVVSLPGAQIVFIDTPGVHRPRHEMNRRMMEATHKALEGVDVVALLVDATESFGAGLRYTIQMLRDLEVPRFLLLNKVDRIDKQRLLPMIAEFAEQAMFDQIVPISALRGDNCGRLVEALLQHLPEGPPLFPKDALTDRSLRFLAAELIREQLLRHTRNELPYTTAVVVERWREPGETDGKTHIEAVVLVESDSQKGIVIGKKGAMLKRVGTAARRGIEELAGGAVYLDLHVKAKAKWREQSRILDELEIEG